MYNEEWLGNIWKMKHPTLRHNRYKAILKDILSREQMKRFGMVGNDSCEMCGRTEMVVHQLFECTNARKLREFSSTLEGVEINTLYDLIACN